MRQGFLQLPLETATADSAEDLRQWVHGAQVQTRVHSAERRKAGDVANALSLTCFPLGGLGGHTTGRHGTPETTPRACHDGDPRRRREHPDPTVVLACFHEAQQRNRQKREGKLEVLMPCKMRATKRLKLRETASESDESNKRQRYACIVEAHEPTRKRLES